VLNRRSFLTNATTGLTATLALREELLAQLQNLPTSLPERLLFEANEDGHWAELRKQFLIPEDEVYLNNGTVGSSPAPVLRAIFDGYTTTEKLDQKEPEDYPIWGYASWNEFRDPLAAFVGRAGRLCRCLRGLRRWRGGELRGGERVFSGAAF
jgi:isopenicillin-N epimerase